MTGGLEAWRPLLDDGIFAVSVLILAAGMAQNLLFTLQLYCGYRELARRNPEEDDERLWWMLTGHVTVPITLIVPAHNEEETIVDSIRSILSLHYPQFEVLVINDGSTDGTLEALIEAFGLSEVERHYDKSVPHRPIHRLYGTPRHPHLLIVDKEQGGKADALNAGISLARTPVFCAVDADSVLESDSLLRAVQPFIDSPVGTVAVGGTIRITNGCRIRSGRILDIGLPGRLLPLFQIVEYLRAFLIGRLGWSYLDSLMLISGAFGIFSRRIVVAVGGYSTDTVGEDLELVIKIHRYMREQGLDYAVRFVPDPVCWTEAPESLRVLGRQRMRWQRGALETFFKHRDMLLDPRYGRAGFIGMGHVLLVDVVGPPVEALGYVIIPLAWALGIVDWPFFAAYLALTVVYGVFISVGSLALEEMELRRFPKAGDLVLLLLAAIAENFGYRQLCNLWRVGGWWQYLRGESHWNVKPAVPESVAEPISETRLARVAGHAAESHGPAQTDPGAAGGGETEADAGGALEDGTPKNSADETSGSGLPGPVEPAEDEANETGAPNAANADPDEVFVVRRGMLLTAERLSAEEVVVEGRLEGKVVSRVLRVMPGGSFSGRAEVESAEIAGHSEGDLTVFGKLSIAGTGVVRGSTRYEDIAIEAGGQILGDTQCLAAAPSRPKAGSKDFRHRSSSPPNEED